MFNLEVVLVAMALGMDSFSLSVGMGCQGLKRNKIWLFTLIVGVFHVVFPLLGLALGQAAAAFFGHLARYLGGGVLIFLGLKLIIEARRNLYPSDQITGGWQFYFLLPVSVSLDAFTVGFGLGTFGYSFLGVALLFGVVAALMTRLGAFLGGQVKGYIGNTGLVAGIILMALGIRAFFF